MITQSDSYNKILEIYDELPKQQKKIADYIISRYDEVVFFSISKLASTLQVSEATVVRFAQNIGHKGFPELKEDLVKYYKEYLTPGERMKRSIKELPDDPLSFAAHVEREIQLLNESVTALDNTSFVETIDRIVESDRIFIFGNGGNECLANHLTFRLSRFKLQAYQQSVSGKNLFERMLQIKKSDLIIVFHFYKPTVDFRRLMDVSKDRDIPVVLITDSLIPPMIREANLILMAPRGSKGTFHSQVVPMAINNAIINGVSSKLGEEAVNAHQELEEMRRKFYYNNDFISGSGVDNN
ncbi:MAG: MurR/RpiR family transcriptional regulator [Spirochaetales bacterium]|nr:MurR/RpiR family transcriptional regulator [Spirochaetales bacterium]